MGTFGENLRELLEETRYGTINRLAGAIEVTPSTLYRWVEHEDPSIPPRVFSRIARELEMPEGEVLRRLTGGKEKEVDMAMERRSGYPAEDPMQGIRDRWSQPMSDRTIAVQALGRLEHYAARIQQLGDEYRSRVDELSRMAQEEISLARRALMRKIDKNDKGESV